jgi:diguanylate cyclase (GGDEF)-like protein
MTGRSAYEGNAVIDIQTFVLALGVGNIAFALLMACYMHGAVRSPALRDWMWARLASGLGQCGWWATPHFGGRPFEVLALCVCATGILLEVAAYCRFFGLHELRHVMPPSIAFVALVVVGALAAGASHAQLTGVVGGLIAVFTLSAASILLHPRYRATLLERIIGINDAIYVVAICIWLVVEKGRISGSLMTPIDGLAYLACYLLMIVTGFGFLLMCKQRDDTQMHRLATIDALTEALNRRAFFERAESARQLALRLRKPIALLMLDLDHFKQLNDSFGHACGDQALRTFTDTARGVLRDGDLMGRLGGEEFALALPGTPLEGAQHAAERLRQAVNEAVIGCAPDYRMSVSVGLVMIEPNEELTAALARADHALYAAKTGGRNRVEIGPAILKRA